MNLGELISWLEAQDANMVVEDGFDSSHSDRGSYDELAFSPCKYTKIGDMLACAKKAVGSVETGYKGGEFLMTEATPVLLGFYGTCGEPITSATLKLWELTGKVPPEESNP